MEDTDAHYTHADGGVNPSHVTRADPCPSGMPTLAALSRKISSIVQKGSSDSQANALQEYSGEAQHLVSFC